ncbi:MAG: thioredoxin family protein [Fimbriimonas sp.]|nr:thioredoxin family protein [Fimbriimonas sp.]
MKLQILGSGCAKCRNLTANAQVAAQQLGLDITIEHVEDIASIMKFGVMCTPALAIDGKVLVSGRVSSHEEIKRMLSEVK